MAQPRDYFAGMAMQAILAKVPIVSMIDHRGKLLMIKKSAFDLADDMMTERGKRKKER